MTTIILTIIGILLAAAAALMVIFYGGDAFNSGSTGAQANTYQNAGTNVIAGYQLANADGVKFSLGDTNYIKETPALPEGKTGTLVTRGNDAYYEVPGVDAAVCTRVNKNLKLTANATETSVKMGCFSNVFSAHLGLASGTDAAAAGGSTTPATNG